MDICARFGLEFDPFVKNSKELIFHSKDFNEAYTRLDYIKNTKGFGIITGAPGSGKTSVIRFWSKSLNPSMFKIIYTALSTLTATEFYRDLAREMDLEPQFKRMDNIRLIQNEITRLNNERKITPVFIIDEANYIRNSILNELKILFNFDMDSKDRAIIILAGMKGLNNTLKLAVHEPLRQRIVMNYDMDGLTKPETKRFVSEKVQNAGCTREIFNDNALEALANTSNGIPRVICKIAGRALGIADSKNYDCVDEEIVRLAAEDCELL